MSFFSRNEKQLVYNFYRYFFLKNKKKKCKLRKMSEQRYLKRLELGTNLAGTAQPGNRRGFSLRNFFPKKGQPYNYFFISTTSPLQVTIVSLNPHSEKCSAVPAYQAKKYHRNIFSQLIPNTNCTWLCFYFPDCRYLLFCSNGIFCLFVFS